MTISSFQVPFCILAISFFPKRLPFSPCFLSQKLQQIFFLSQNLQQFFLHYFTALSPQHHLCQIKSSEIVVCLAKNLIAKYKKALIVKTKSIVFYEIASITIFLNSKMSLGLRKFFFSICVAALASLSVLLQEKKVPQQLFLLRVLSELTRRTLRRKSCFRTFFPLGEPRGMLQQQQKYFRKFFSAPQTFFSVRNIFIEAISQKKVTLTCTVQPNSQPFGQLAQPAGSACGGIFFRSEGSDNLPNQTQYLFETSFLTFHVSPP